MDCLKTSYLVIGAIGLWVMSFCLLRPQNTVVVFDKKIVMQAFVTELSHQSLSEQQLKVLTSRFAKILKETLHAYAQKNHVVILKKEQILQDGGLDISVEIAEQVAQSMRGRL